MGNRMNRDTGLPVRHRPIAVWVSNCCSDRSCGHGPII